MSFTGMLVFARLVTPNQWYSLPHLKLPYMQQLLGSEAARGWVNPVVRDYKAERRERNSQREGVRIGGHVVAVRPKRALKIWTLW